MHGIKLILRISPLCCLALLVGCSSDYPLMPTPNIYTDPGDYPATEVPESLRSSQVELLYVTDRTRETDQNGETFYGAGRSSSAAYGSVVVEIGNAEPWEELVKASQTVKRKQELLLRIHSLQEHARFPETPYSFSVVDGTIVEDEETRAEYEQTADKFRRDLGERLADLQRKEVIVFIHGFNNTFQSSALVLAELWHFTGRRGVPLLYSWPAASGGLFGYFIDRESGEFTIFHLKEFLRLLADTPDIQRIHIIAHSRGTDVMTTALRELVIESRAAGRNPLKDLRIANLILAAPDLDFEVVKQRLIAEKFGPAIGKITIYTNQEDTALNVSESLMSGTRFGRLDSEDLGQKESQIFSQVRNVHIINVEGEVGFLGHSYFRDNPGVSSDLAILIRDGSEPGSEMRPLVHRILNFWDLPAGYPAQAPQ
jgi:esterase/lipase superfamily enzyme